MIIHNCAQGTPEWNMIRSGIPTASMFSSILTAGGKRSESAGKYMAHLLAERILGRYIDGFQSKYMELGNQHESRAIASYEISHEYETYKVGFVTTDDGRIGCSPDRFIVDCDAGMVEAKAPSPAVHVSYMLSDVGASKEYKVQLQGQLWTCQRDWDDIVSYAPEMPEVVFRTERDDKFIALLEEAVREFSEKLEETAAQFMERGWIKAPEVPVVEQSSEFITDADLSALMADRFPDYQEAI